MRAIFIKFIVFTLPILVCQAQPQLFSSTRVGPGTAKGRGMKRARQVEADSTVLTQAERIGLNLFDDRQFIANRVREREEQRGRLWIGEIEGAPGSNVMLVTDEKGRLTGSVSVSPDEFYTIRHDDDGQLIIGETDFSASIVDDIALVPPPELLQEDQAPQKDRSATTPMVALASAVSTVDLLVVYTPEAKTAAGGLSSILGKINLAISETNQAYVNSGINIQLHLVAAIEGGPSSGQAASQSYLSQVTYDASIAALRNQYGADLVSMWVNGPGSGGGVVGLGWIMQNPSVSFQSVAFHVVEVNFTNGPYYSFGHEIGHNLGGAHDRANSSAAGSYAYSYGFQQPAGGFVTMMAYTGGCASCRRMPYFSNPSVSLNGYPTGIGSTSPVAADMASTFNSTRAYAEQWRATVVPVTPPSAAPTYAPTVTSVAPSAGAGSSPVFTAVFDDRNGAADIRSLLVAIQTGSAQNACLLTIDRPSSSIILRDNANAGWISGAKVGQATSVSNSQCTISGAGITITPVNNAVTLSLPVDFLPAFGGTHDVYLKTEDFAGLNSSWQKLGTWTVLAPSAPVFQSLAPTTGSGVSTTYTVQVADANGANNIDSIQLLVNSRLSGLNSCHIAYLPATNRIYLLNDTATAWSTGVAPGTAGTLQNSQCSLALATAQAQKTGNLVTLALPVAFAPGYSGLKNAYTLAVDRDGLRADWAARGTWTVSGGAPPVAPSFVSLTPNTGSGASAPFVIQASDGNGIDNIDSIQILMNSRFSGVSSCHIAYLPITNRIYLLNDTATVWTGGVAPGTAGTLQNSQCGLALASAQVQRSGNTVSLTVPVSFSSAYSGSKIVYGMAADRDGLRADWAPRGSWTSP